jgi:hypothetical protein
MKHVAWFVEYITVLSDEVQRQGPYGDDEIDYHFEDIRTYEWCRVATRVRDVVSDPA